MDGGEVQTALPADEMEDILQQANPVAMRIDDERGGVAAGRCVITVAEDGKFRLILRRVADPPRQDLQAILPYG